LTNALHHALLSVPIADARVGDIALFNMEGNPQHLGIISDYGGASLGIIHAYAPARAVVEHVLDASWQSRIIGVFRVFT
jgi:uncharacterized protein YijF (DUF1287 family)